MQDGAFKQIFIKAIKSGVNFANNKKEGIDDES